ncbi:Glycosyl hydrolase family 31, partial [Trichostrongylus colubriformis]
MDFEKVYNRPGEHLCSKTLCMLAKTGRRTMDFYNTKNLYGMSEAKATIQALSATTGKRGAVISRSTFPSSGRYGGVWLGDNTATWKDLKTSVIGVMEFNFFGLPYVGSDICGFNGNTTEELCLRWHQMAAFHPFCRNHNTQGGNPQDPAVWPSVAKAARIALGFRYKYLPYLYSLLYAAAVDGHTVIRPLFFEYPTDFVAMDIDHQFLWGSAIMVAPALEQNVTSVHAYFPSDTWYSLVPE